ncbi:MFS transporter [Rubellimicrobium arenae]|uniref:MFS transporter n=1 Tax=Rubellimicrobium arenae TaxID=2817372 RepID=UPI001B30C564|nr:MFS transporter [Rubellimicrobium arenae]
MTARPAPSPTLRGHHLVPRLVALVLFMQFLDGTIIATSLPAIARDFGTDPVGMGVGVTAYLLALAAVVPAAGWLGGRWGARTILVGSIAIFTLSSLACALAPNLGAFVAARVLQGAAAALMAPVGRLLVLAHVPRSELMGAIATITWPALLAPVAGPVVGAVITEHAGWEWNFLVNLPLGLGAMALVLRLVPDQPTGTPAPFDGRGFAFCSLGLLGLLGGLELFVNGSRRGLAAGGLLAGLMLLILAARHLRRARTPLLDLSVLAVPSFRLATMTAGTLGRTAINSAPFLLPLLFQVGFGLSALEAGQALLVYFLGNLLMKSLTTPVLRRFGFRPVVVVNGLLAALGVGVFAAVPADIPLLGLWTLLFVAGAARSLQFTALNTLAFAEIGPDQRAASTTLSAMTQQVAQVLGVALAVALIRTGQAWHGGSDASLPQIRIAFAGMGVIGLASALGFLRLAPGTGREVAGRSD